MDSPIEQITQNAKQPTSRRGFLAGISRLFAGGMILPFLSLDPGATQAAAQRSHKGKFPMNTPDCRSFPWTQRQSRESQSRIPALRARKYPPTSCQSRPEQLHNG